MKDIADFHVYVDGVHKASDRARGAFFVLLIISALFWSAFMTTQKLNWMTVRLDLASNTLANYDRIASPNSASAPLGNEGLERERWYFAATGSPSKDVLSQRVKNLIAGVEESRVMSIPLIGVKMHTNDLSFVAGLLISFAYFIMYQCVRRELDNLKLAKRAAERLNENDSDSAGTRERCLQLLAMGQVLTNPHQAGNKLLSFIQIVLVFLPATLLARIVIEDWRTVDVGLRLNEYLAVRTLTVGSVSLIVSFVLAIAVRRNFAEIDRAWIKWRSGVALEAAAKGHLEAKALILTNTEKS